METEPLYRFQHLIRQDCPVTPGTHVVAYMRDSGGEEQDKSVAQQIEVVREYCQRHYLVLEHVYTDESKLSSNTASRTGLQDLLGDLHRRFKQIRDRYKRDRLAQQKPFGVIFWKGSRLGRDSIEAEYIKLDLMMRAITVIDLVTAANTGNSGIDRVIDAFQRWEDERRLDDISTDAKRALTALVSLRDNDPDFLQHNPDWKSTGAYLGIRPGPAPKGFKGEWVTVGTYKRKGGRRSGELRRVQRLVPDPETWEKCRQAWEMRKDGVTVEAIHNKLHLFNKIAGYAPFFRNRIYTGDIVYSGVLYENFLPAMIPKEWFDRVQSDRAERERQRQGNAAARDLQPGTVGSGYLLSGMVYCGAVEGEEHPMHFESIRAVKGKRGAYRFAICNVAKDTRKQKCQAGRVNLRLLEPAVIDNLNAHVLTIENLREVARNVAQSYIEQSRDASSRVEDVEQKLEEVRKSLNNVLDAIEKMGYARHLQERYDARRQEEEALLTELSRLKALQAPKSQLAQLTEERLETWLAQIRAEIAGEDTALARRVLQLFIDRIVVKDKMVTIAYKFPLASNASPSSFQNVDLRGRILETRYFFTFPLPVASSTFNKERYPDKAQLRLAILAMRGEGMSLRDIGHALGISFGWVGQILKT
jgi:hypothetical protein